MLEKGKINFLLDLSYGSSSKAQICTKVALEERPHFLMASHGPSSSHTVIDEENGIDYVFKVLPSATSVYKMKNGYKPIIVLSPSSGFYVDQLIKELDDFGVPKENIIVPYRAYVVEEKHQQMELEKMGGKNHLGSTVSGQSAAYCAKVARSKDSKLAGEVEELKSRVTVMDYDEYTDYLKYHLDNNYTIFCELPQGFPLSLHYSIEPRKSTYRDVNPMEVMSAIGLNHTYLGKIIGNIRMYPIRVSNRFTDNDINNVVVEAEIDGKIVTDKAVNLGLNYDDINAIAQRVSDGEETEVIGLETVKINKIISGLEGTSGSFEDDLVEVSWSWLSNKLGEDVAELTTLTKLPRRIAIPKNSVISTELIRKSIKTIKPDYISMTFLNYDILNRTPDEIVSKTTEILKGKFGKYAPEVKIAQYGKDLSDITIYG